jgi:hypothetical protein
MTLTLMLKKTPEPSVSSMSKEQCRRLLRRVWAFGTKAPARLYLGSVRPSRPSTGNLHTPTRCAPLLRLLGRSQQHSLGIFQASQALSRDFGRSQAPAKAISQEKTPLRYLGQFLSPPNRSRSPVGSRQSKQHDLRMDSDKCFLAQPHRMSFHRYQELGLHEHILSVTHRTLQSYQ